MAWAEIYKYDNADYPVSWRVYLNDSFTSEDDSIALTIVDAFKPVLDLVEPKRRGMSRWVYWEFSKEEYDAMMRSDHGVDGR